MHCIELSTSKVPRLELEYELCWSRDRVAEGAPLLREYVGKTCIEGSNPSDSAKHQAETRLRARFAFLNP